MTATTDAVLGDFRAFQFGPYGLIIQQDVKHSGALRSVNALLRDSVTLTEGDATDASQANDGKLDNVGFIVWQSGVLLCEVLLQHPPLQQWTGVRVVDLGTGTGIVAAALALAGADVVATDLPHVTPLTRCNVSRNCTAPWCRIRVADYQWGQGDTSVLGAPPDVITGADLLYDESMYVDLVATLKQLAAPHTLVFLAYRCRGQEKAFESLLTEEGFVVQPLPEHMISRDFRDGKYRVVQAAKLGC